MVLLADPVRVYEGEVAQARVRLSRLAGAPAGEVRVTLRSRPGTAGGDDFAVGSAAVVLAAGQSSATVPLLALEDSAAEADETFVLVFSATGASDAQMTVTILDDDARSPGGGCVPGRHDDGSGGCHRGHSVAGCVPGRSVVWWGHTAAPGGHGYLTVPACRTAAEATGPQMSVLDVAVSEGGVAVVTFSLWPSPTVVVEGTWAVAAASAGPGDAAMGSGTFTFDPQRPTAQVSVQIADDSIPEPAEYFVISASAAGAAAEAAVTVLDDDVWP